MVNENEELAYSFHIGNDRNKSKNARKKARSNASGTTSYNNNAIQNSRQLGTVDHHNLRKYDNHQELIETIRGTNNIIADVKNLYQKEFEEARKKYNQKQTRDDRKIDNYYNKIATEDKHDLACQIIVELGDMNFWKDKSMHEKYKMNLVFDEQLTYLEEIVPQFKIANATVHYDESSPHLHIVGIAIKENCKTGLERQVGKTTVFTRDSLRVIQDKMRKHCIDTYNKIYDVDNKLKPKKKGRNFDYKSSEMEDVKELEKQQEKQQEKIKEITDKTEKLDNKSIEVKEIIDNLKPTALNKNNSIISNNDKQFIVDFIEEVNSSSDNFKELTDYNLSLEKVKNHLENKDDKIRELNNNISNQKDEIDKLNYDINIRNKQINKYEKQINDLKTRNNKLKEENKTLKNTIKNIFNSLKTFFRTLLKIGNEETKDMTTHKVKGYYNKGYYKQTDIYDIGHKTTKEKELFNFADINKTFDNLLYEQNENANLFYDMFEEDEDKEKDDFDLSI